MRAARSLPADGWVAPGAVAAASSLSQDSGLLLSLSHPEGESTIRVHSSALLTFPDVQVLSCRPTGRMNVPEGGLEGAGQVGSLRPFPCQAADAAARCSFTFPFVVVSGSFRRFAGLHWFRLRQLGNTSS